MQSFEARVQAGYTYTLGRSHESWDRMARPKEMYSIVIHYPEDEKDILNLKRKMGSAYSQFIKSYILALPLNDEEKNRLYASVIRHLSKQGK